MSDVFGAAPQNGWLNDASLSMIGRFAAVHGRYLTTGVLDANGLELVMWSDPAGVDGYVHLAEPPGASLCVQTLSYANGKVWIASTSGSTVTWYGYDVTL